MVDENAAVTDTVVERVGLYAFLVNLLLVGLKAALATLSGSLALTADAVDSATDTVASLAVWLGLRISRRKSAAFPYGLYKVENITSVVVAILIFFAGYEIARNALYTRETRPQITPWVLVGAGLTVIIPYLFSRYAVWMGQRANSPSLIAEGRHRQVDVLSSLIVLAAIASNYLGLALDRWAAVVVVIFIAYAGWELLADGMRVLLDASLDAETLAQVRRIIEAQPSGAEVKGVMGRNSGRYRFIEAEITLRVRDLEKAHIVSRQIEAEIRAQVPHVDRVLIHYEPLARTVIRYAAPLADSGGTLSQHFGEAPYFTLADVKADTRELLRQEILANPHQAVEKAKGIRVAEWLVEQKVDVVLIRESLRGKGPEYVFADAGVELVITDSPTALDAVAAHGQPSQG